MNIFWFLTQQRTKDKMSKQNNKFSFALPNEPIAPTVAAPQAPKISIEQAMQIAEQHQQAGRLPQAEHVLRDILGAVPRHAKAIHLLGVVAHMSDKTELAVDLISKAISINDKIALFHANIAEMYRRLERLDEAVKYARKAIALEPGFLFGQGNLGIIYFDLKDYEKAAYHHNLALKIDPNFAPSLNNVGSILRHRDDYEGAADYFRRAIKASPNFLDPQNNLGEILTRLDRPEEALELLNRVLAVNPRYDSAHCNRGMALLTLGDEAESHASYMRALQITPDFVPAYAGLVMLALEFHRLEEGEQNARKLLEIAPEEADSHSMLGSILLAQGLTENAESHFINARKLDEDYIPAKTGIGHVFMERGDLKGAEDMFRSCVEAEGETSPAIYSLIQVRKVKPDDPEIQIMEKEAKKLEGKLIDSKAIPLNFALGKMYDDLGEYERGFPYYIEGCRLKRKQLNYSTEEKEANIEHMKEVFTADFIKKNTGHGDPSQTPIFVLGMPRSGTTLTEQVIASHPSVHGAGELRDLITLAESFMPERTDMPFSTKMLDATPEDLNAMGQQYLAGLKERDPDAIKITDKMPGNFHYIGLIKLILPNAKIVHVSRHPLDTCISCFTRLFAHGQANTYDLAEIGHYYKCYKGLMDHWRNVLPEDSFYDLRYERLVDDTEAEAKKLIEYCGLEWDKSCLEFYKNKRSIRTASVTQVRQPIYKTSKQRWKNYEQFLGPMIEALGEAAEY